MTHDRRRRAAWSVLAFANVVALFFQAGDYATGQERPGPAPRQEFSLRWVRDPIEASKAAVEVSGLSATALKELEQWHPAQWQRLLSVYASQGDLNVDISVPAMLGKYRIESGMLRFEPRFPLEPGIAYKAIFHPDQLPGEKGSGQLIAAAFRVAPRESKQLTVVTHVYPSAEILPENLLKFYVHFSAPMSRGHIYDHIHLRDDTGKDIELPFLEIDEELWDPAMTRLTLFIDPGRIKRGVRPLEEVGPALEAGKHYTLVIDRAWKDGAGNSLEKSFQKAFMVAPPDRDPPDPAHWRIHAPTTRDPLIVTFPEPMDHALAQRVIQVAGASGERVEGKTTLDDHERRWKFIPARPWHRGRYNLVVQTTIEDLAGNNIGKPFEVDVVERVQARLSNRSVKLPFDVR